jgi:hypothetical protein
MATLTNSRIAFIHVPKTGGIWANVAMRKAGIELQETENASEIRRGHFAWNEVPNTLFRFGFVRHPVGWYRSYWSHRNRHQDWGDEILDNLARAPFPEFIEAVAAEAPGYLSRLYEFFLGPPGEIEFIGRYENLQHDLITALETAGQPFDVEAIRSTPPANVSAERPPMPKEAGRIIEAEQPLIERFYRDTKVGV